MSRPSRPRPSTRRASMRCSALPTPSSTPPAPRRSLACLRAGTARHRVPPHARSARYRADRAAAARQPARRRRAIAGADRPVPRRRARMKIAEMNWRQVEDYLQRDDRALCRWARSSSTPISAWRSTHPERAGRRRGGRAARRAGVPGRALRDHALLPGLSGHGRACASRPTWRSSATSWTASRARASAAS